MPADGKIKALDMNSNFVAVGREAWAKAGVAHKIDFIEGPATASLQAMIDAGESDTYDIVFIDANKNDYLTYYEQLLKLVRVGGIIAVDNTLFDGTALGPIDFNLADTDEERYIKPIRQLNRLIQSDDRVAAVMSIIADGVYLVRKLK